jgi:hypothetical protein
VRRKAWKIPYSVRRVRPKKAAPSHAIIMRLSPATSALHTPLDPRYWLAAWFWLML